MWMNNREINYKVNSFLEQFHCNKIIKFVWLRPLPPKEKEAKSDPEKIFLKKLAENVTTMENI